MERRGFLATAAVVAVAGCSTSEIEDFAGSGDGGDTPSGDDTSSGDGTPAGADTTSTGGTGDTGPTDTSEPGGSDPTDTGGTDDPGPTEPRKTTISAGNFSGPTDVAKAFYAALIDQNISKAREMVHPDHPGVPSFPITEEHAPPAGTTIDSVVVADQADDIVAVGVNMTQPDERPLTEQIGVRTHEDGWLVWRTDNCIDVSC